MINEFYNGQGDLIEQIKAASAKNNPKATKAIQAFLFNTRHSVQTSFATALLLAVGRTDLAYDTTGRIDKNLLRDAFETFKKHYSEQASNYIEPIVFGDFVVDTYPTFSKLLVGRQSQTSGVVVGKDQYTNNLTGKLANRQNQVQGQGQTQAWATNNQGPQVTPPASQAVYQPQMSAAPSGFLINGGNMVNSTPFLERFKVKSIDDTKGRLELY